MLVLVGRVHFINTSDFMDPNIVASTAAKIVDNQDRARFGVFAYDVSTYGLPEKGSINLAAASYLFIGKDKATIARGFAQKGEMLAEAGKEGTVAFFTGRYKANSTFGFFRKKKLSLQTKSRASDQSFAEIRNGINYKMLGQEGTFVLLGINEHFDPTEQGKISLCGTDRVSFLTLSSVLANRDVSYTRSFGSKLASSETFLNKIKLGTNSRNLKQQVQERNQEANAIPFIDDDSEIDENI